MALTGEELLTGLSTFMGDLWTSAATSSGASDSTSLIDTAARRFGDDTLRGFFIRITQADTNLNLVRRITRNESATGTITFAPAVAEVTITSDTYQIHRYDPSTKFNALDKAGYRAWPEVAQVIFDDTTTADGVSSEYSIPTTIRRGPGFVFSETPSTRSVSWNFLTSPDNDSTTGWTTSNLTAAVVSSNDYDLLVPKYGNSATKLQVAASTAGTYSQTVASMVNVTAADAASRRVTEGVWVCAWAASRITLLLIDDSGTVATSSTHQGRGWELLTVSGNIMGNNATTLTLRLSVSSGAAITLYVNGSWMYYGDTQRITDIYWRRYLGRIRRDGTTQSVMLNVIPMRGHQLRFVGRAPLSILGTAALTQGTNTKEIDAPTAEILYAEAATYLYENELLNAAMPAELAARITMAIKRKEEAGISWGFNLPANAGIRSHWVS